MSDMQTAISQLQTARDYTCQLLSHIEPSDWFRQPAEGVTHVAWQVGHLAVAQYGLALKRVRGERADDAKLIPVEFRQLFGKGSVPESDPGRYPSIEEIRGVFDRVFQQTIAELQTLPESSLAEPANDPPHPMFQTKLGALFWCAQHEFIHDGQIALLRRLFGAQPLR